MPNWSCNALIVTAANDSPEAVKQKADFFAEALSVVDTEERNLFAKFFPRPASQEDNWYDWNCANWGTKWDACELDIDVGSDTLRFQTAWAPPEKWMEKVSKDYPELNFELAYSEWGMQFAGVSIYNNGKVVSETDIEVTTDEVLDEDEEVEDYSPSGEYAAHLEKYGIGMGG